MKKLFNFEFKVVLLVLIIFILVTITGLLTYQRFSNIVNGITTATRPDLRLVTAHSLENNLIELESSAKTYSLTSDTAYLEQFYKNAEKVEKELSILAKHNKNEENKIDLILLDSLITEKFATLNELLYMQDQYRVQQALSKVVIGIDKTSVNSDEVLTDTDESDQKSKKKLLDWFKRKKKKEAEIPKVEEKPDPNLIQVTTVNSEIQKVKNEEVGIENELKLTELSLITEDKIISQKIANLLDDFEEKEKLKLLEAATDAKSDSVITNRQIAVFVVFSGALLIFMAILIINYSRKNRKYQVALKNSQNEAENLARTRERFLANMSHEIRTPMNAISGFAEQLSNEILNETQRDYVNMIQKSSQHLTYLINDVLDFSKLQGGKMKLEKINFSLNDLVSDVITFSKQLATDKRITIKSKIDDEVPLFLVGDPFRLRQILLNLTSNAVKFTSKGKVDVHVSFVEIKPYKKVALKFDVIDTGIGMDSAEQARVFNEFEQASANTAKHYGGTGLGLAITKMLVELQSGSVILKSEKDKGTTVSVELIFGIGNESVQNQVVIDLPEIIAKRILVADDELYNRKLLLSIFKNYDIELDQAEDGQVALDLLRINNYDLLLLDARMPNIDGIQLLQRMKEEKLGTNMKVIMLTAAVDAENKLQFETLGADGILPKPFSTKQLLSEIFKVYQGNSIVNNEDNQTIVTNQRVNFAQLRTLSGSDQAFYIDMLQTFVNSTKNGYQTMKIAFENDDWQLLANEAHRISSPCKHMGADELYEMLKSIELDSRTNENTDYYKSILKSLDEEIHLVLSQVKQELASL